MKLNVILCISTITFAAGQRPTYAGTGPVGRPNLASRFQDNNAVSTTTPIATDIANRIGDAAAASSTTNLPLPVDARGDGDLVKRLNEWPRENRPFWLLNAEHIEAARNEKPQQNVQNRNMFESADTIAIRPTEPRSSFLSRT